ncbi:MAG: hypothetical protein PVH45_03580 [Candidatus Omnitrophota bacterium]|jgi:alpha-aminoadipic semialdehyde synthase
MRKNLVVGILKEEKNEWERRAPLTPADVKWLVKRGVDVEVESSPIRVFKDQVYRKAGAKIVKKLDKADIVLGIKGPREEKVKRDKLYMFFSHMTKGQPQNMPLLKKMVKSDTTLVDYEKITDIYGRRLVYFGRYAGICGMVDSLFYLGRKLEWKGIDNPFALMKPSWAYNSFDDVKKDMEKVNRRIKRKGFAGKSSPFVVGITGHGNVSKGAQEVLELLNPVEVHPKDMKKFIKHQKYAHNEVYKIVFLREEKLRSKKGTGFYFEEYLQHPSRFESNLDKYLPYLNMLVHTSYWDERYPRMVTKSMVKKAFKKKDFRLDFIGDISCDINGSIEFTYKASPPDHATYTYNPKKDTFIDGYEDDGITILAVDNLPAELPKDSSEEFSKLVRDYVYQVSAHGVKDITNHIAIPREVRKAVLLQKGRFTEAYRYMKKFISKIKHAKLK